MITITVRSSSITVCYSAWEMFGIVALYTYIDFMSAMYYSEKHMMHVKQSEKHEKQRSSARKGSLRQYAEEVEELNFRVFRSVAFYMMATLLSLGIFSFVPNTVLAKTNYRILCFSMGSLGFAFYVSCVFASGTVKKHATIFMYAIMVSLQIFFLFLEYFIALYRGHYSPYSLPLGFMLIQPIIIIDENVRKNLFTACTVAVLISFSVYLKPESIAINDIINTIPFGVSGCAIGMVSKTYVFNYLDRKVSEKYEDLEKAKSESKAKSEFLAFVNHEIRSPMNTIVGLNEMILRESNDSVALNYSKEIKQACGTLSLLINDILDFSKINSNEFSLVSVEYKLDSILNDLLNIAVPRAQEKDLAFIVSVQADTPNNLIGDDLRIKQCIMNLLSNAIKYTDAGKVSFSVTWKPVQDDSKSVSLTFVVADTGCGIKPEDLERITSPFERLDELKNRSVEGSGLGLSIVKELLQKMDSTLCISSEYGLGSCFSFTIRQSVGVNAPIGEYTIDTYTKERKGASAYGTFVAPHAHILVVDDLQMNLDIIRALLKCTQIHIDAALSGRDAIDLVRLNHYDIVFIDHRMPDMDGIETLQAIKQLDMPTTSGTKFIALTANASRGSKVLYMNEGFDDYLPKPVDSEELERMLASTLPPQLVQMQKNGKAKQEHDSSDDGKSKFIASYSGIEGVDCNAAISLCQDVSVLKEAVKTFYKESDKKIAALQQGMESGSEKPYVIAAHSLKTELRLIGYASLSKQAALLEFFCNNGDRESVREYTLDFVANLQHFKDKLKCIVEKSKSISPEDYHELMMSLKECSQAQDMSAAEHILHMVDGYSIPDGEDEFFTLLRQAVRNRNAELFEMLMVRHSA